MNLTLFKATFRQNRIFLLIISLVLLMYSSIIIGMYEPDASSAMEAMLEALPKSLVTAFGFDGMTSTLIGHVASYLYGFIFLMFPLIYTCLTANELMAKHVDSGSMAYLLATPNTRVRIAGTQALYLFVMTTLIVVSQTILGLLMCEAMLPGLLDRVLYIRMNIVTLTLFWAVGAVSFLFSCIMNETRFSLSFGMGIPIGLLFVKMLSGTSDKVEWLRFATPFSLIDAERIFSDTSYIVVTGSILTLAAGVLYAAAIMMFDRRNLTL